MKVQTPYESGRLPGQSVVRKWESELATLVTAVWKADPSVATWAMVLARRPVIVESVASGTLKSVNFETESHNCGPLIIFQR